MSTPYPVHLAGEELWLLPEKAIYWPAQQALLIADVHFGKAAAYRSLGQPVPQGTTASNITVLNMVTGSAALPAADFSRGFPARSRLPRESHAERFSRVASAAPPTCP